MELVTEIRGALPVSVAGGKGASLGRLMAAGLPVPPAFVVPADVYRAQLRDPAIAPLLTGGESGEDRAAIQDALRRTPLPGTLRDALASALDALGGPVAVRSSGIDEDGAERSFAGQFDTALDIDGLEACEDALRAAWASLWGDRAAAYAQGTAGGAMAVVIQRMVPARAAGVAFTADPVTGREGILVIEAVLGLGEGLVSGRLTPERHRIGPDGAVEVERAGAPVLSGEEVRAIADLARRAEAVTDGPADVEWAIADGRPWLLQARPVTAVDLTLLDTPSDPELVWMDTNAAELFPFVATPMTYDAIDKTIYGFLGPLMRRIGIDMGVVPFVGVVGGRVYVCASVFIALIQSIPGMRGVSPTQLFGGDAATLGAALEGRDPAILRSIRAHGWRNLLYLFTFVLWVSTFFRRRPEPYMAHLVEERRRIEAFDPAHAPDLALLDHLDESLSFSERSWELAIGASGFGLGMGNLVEVLCRRWLGDEDGRLFRQLLGAQGGVESADAGLDLWRLVERLIGRPLGAMVAEGGTLAHLRPRIEASAEGRVFMAELEGFLERHGHHTRGEVDIAQPRWRDEPDRLLDALRAWASAPPRETPLQAHARHRAAREVAEREALGRLGPLRRWIFTRALGFARWGAPTREGVKSEGVRRVAIARRDLLEIGRRLTARGVITCPDDVFFLDLAEMKAALTEASPQVAGRIRRRRATWDRLQDVRPPPVVVGSFDPTAPLPEEPAADGAPTLSGIPVSAGVVEGRARVLLTAADAAPLLPGEILVAPFTDPGWTPWLVAASGVVVDVGGLLSHGSIIAREYALPAVVNVRHGTRRIVTGQRIRVDGNRGIVTLMEAGEGRGEGPGAPVENSKV